MGVDESGGQHHAVDVNHLVPRSHRDATDFSNPIPFQANIDGASRVAIAGDDPSTTQQH